MSRSNAACLEDSAAQLLHGFLQGQAVVPASEAQIIYSLTPIPAAAFAALLPGGAEAMGLLGYLVSHSSCGSHRCAVNRQLHAAACRRQAMHDVQMLSCFCLTTNQVVPRLIKPSSAQSACTSCVERLGLRACLP